MVGMALSVMTLGTMRKLQLFADNLDIHLMVGNSIACMVYIVCKL